MSFRCENCNSQREPGEPQIKRVVDRRAKSYTGGGVGWEIVKEVAVGKCCETKVPTLVSR